jgi:predicted transcriptional regulator
MKKRTRLEIIRDILELLRSKRDVRITHLIYKSNLSNNSIKPYISELIEKGFIVMENGENNKCFNISKKGLEFLEEFNKIKIFSDAYGL